MSSLFYRVFLQAKKCFGSALEVPVQENFAGNFQQLKKIVNQITINDLNINPYVATQEAFDCDGKSPCTFISIYDSDEFTMTVFVLRDGYTMPLHDHPKMHGLLRVIAGQVQIRSYTKVSDNVDGTFLGQVEPLKELSSETEAATLTPTHCNYHEITAVNGPAAFFDILGPPYDFDHPVYGKRRCNFYQKLTRHTNADAEQVVLQRIPSPDHYFCDTAPYYPPDFLFED